MFDENDDLVGLQGSTSIIPLHYKISDINGVDVHMTESQLNWHKYFLRMADFVSTKSKDESTKIGAVIVDSEYNEVSTGYNGLCRGLNDLNPEYKERPMKYHVTAHAESNAIFKAARRGTSVNNCTLYINIKPYICVDCAKAIIQSGIKQIIASNKESFVNTKQKWEKDAKISKRMFEEVGIQVISIDLE